MSRSHRTGLLSVLSLAAGVALAVSTAPTASAAPAATVLHVGQIAEQNVEPEPGSEPDTLVEPDVAVSPIDPDIAVAAAHEGRYPSHGGAVAIAYAWTSNGGATWRHGSLPNLTKATGGEWERASDPSVAFGPDGDAYVSTLLLTEECPLGLAVSRSTNGGRTFGDPVVVHSSDTCDSSDDKGWLIADTGEDSPYRGRLYQFWTAVLSGDQGSGHHQALRWSDDHGRTWSRTVNVTSPGSHTQNSQPMIQPDGTIVDTYFQGVGRELVARTSTDGGETWSEDSTIAVGSGGAPDGVRCCLPSATSDAVTGSLYTTWMTSNAAAVMISRSDDGRTWSDPVAVSPERTGRDHVNADVAAYDGTVYVAYGTRDLSVEDGRYVHQQLSISDDGEEFDAPIKVGKLSDLNYAAEAAGKFPGDYAGSAATEDRYYSVWCRSSTPPDPDAEYHQTLWGATLATG